MCGIVGIAGPGAGAPEGRGLVARMAGTMVHRGPDGEGYVHKDDCALGFRRLAICDVDAAASPFSTGDGAIWSIANAEIYNAASLKDRLADRGHSFTTRVDTEVIPHLYEEMGPDFVEQLDGMFALAVWDSHERRLILARDRAGEKPLFYWHDHDTLVFASELGALLAHPRIERRVDPIALRRYLLHDFFPAPLTPFAGIRKLPAAHLLVWHGGEVSLRRYWDLADYFGTSGATSRAAAARELDLRIAEAVERRRQSDVPVGVFLSGGLDSTTVLAHLSEQAGPGVPVFSIGHTEQSFDESRFARETARFYDADYHELVLSQADLGDGLGRVAAGFDEPLGDASTIPTHLLSRYARQKVKVVLSGEGADELFAGYPTYLGHRAAGWYRRLPAIVRRALLGGAERIWPLKMGNVGPDYLIRRFTTAALLDPIERHHTWFGSIGPGIQAEILSPRVLESLAGDDAFGTARQRLAGRNLPDDLARFLYTDFTMYLQDDLLTKVDRASMLASLESRAPFLDHRLAEFAASLPSKRKLSGLQTKAILRQAERRRLPPAVLKRRKRGFNIPFSRWLLDGLGEQMRQRFSPERIEARGLLGAGGVNRLLDEHLAGHADHRKPLFTLLAFDLWCDRFFPGDGPIEVASPGEPARRALEAPIE